VPGRRTKRTRRAKTQRQPASRIFRLNTATPLSVPSDVVEATWGDFAAQLKKAFGGQLFGATALRHKLFTIRAAATKTLATSTNHEDLQFAREIVDEVEILWNLRKAEPPDLDQVALSAMRVMKLYVELLANMFFSDDVRAREIQRKNLLKSPKATKAQCEAAQRTFGTKKAAADSLGIHVKTFNRMLEK